MRMSSINKAGSAVAVKTKCPFFAGGFRMEVHQNHVTRLCLLCHYSIKFLKRRANAAGKLIFKENSGIQINNQITLAVFFNSYKPPSRKITNVITGSDQIRKFIKRF